MHWLAHPERGPRAEPRCVLQAQTVFDIPELLDMITGFCDPPTLASLRATCSLARSVSYDKIRALHVDVPSERWVLPTLAPLVHFRRLAVLRLTLDRATTEADLAAARDVILAVLYLLPVQPPGLVLTTGFDFGAGAAQALAEARTVGHTTVIAHAASRAPVFRNPPPCVPGPRLTLAMQLYYIDGLELAGLCYLTSLTVSCHTLRASNGPAVDEMLLHFDCDRLPNLVCLDLTMVASTRLDFTLYHECGVDLSQLRCLSISGCTLDRPDISGLAIIAPMLTGLHLCTRGHLGVPSHTPLQVDGEIFDPAVLCWADMTRLSLQLEGATDCSYSDIFQFPLGLTTLKVRSERHALPFRLHSSNFNALARLSFLHLQGVAFHNAFYPPDFELRALRHVILRDLPACVSYQPSVRQIALRCPDIATVCLRGRATQVMESVGADAPEPIVCLRRRAAASAVGRRLWPEIPLTISSMALPPLWPGFVYACVVLAREEPTGRLSSRSTPHTHTRWQRLIFTTGSDAMCRRAGE